MIMMTNIKALKTACSPPYSCGITTSLFSMYLQGFLHFLSSSLHSQHLIFHSIYAYFLLGKDQNDFEKVNRKYISRDIHVYLAGRLVLAKVIGFFLTFQRQFVDIHPVPLKVCAI